jgi:hypothetical protein
MDLSSPNPLLLEIEAYATVSKLKERIKKKMGYGCPHNTLNLFQVSKRSWFESMRTSDVGEVVSTHPVF